MNDPKPAADEAARTITRKLIDRGFLPECGVTSRFVEEYVSGVVLATITRCVPTPCEGLNDK